MKFNRILFFVIAATLIAVATFSCSKIESIPENEMEAVGTASDELLPLTRSEVIALAVQKKGTYAIPESEALCMLKRYTASDDNERAISVKSTVLKKNAKTGKDMYYVFVFESEKGTGFSLVSADERAPDLLCYSEKGAISDTSFNKSMKFCFELIDIYMDEQTKGELDVETLALSAKEKMKKIALLENQPITSRGISAPIFDPNDPKWIYDGGSIEEITEQRLKQIKGGWHQSWPFNNLLPYVAGIGTWNERAFAGCAMIAVTQIMSYHRKPFGNPTYIITSDWQSMIDYPNSSAQLQSLIRDAFDNMNTGYDATGTSSNITKARNFLNNNGYTAGATSSYSFTGVWNALQWGPTFIRGSTSADEGHAWVVDGARKIQHYLYEYYHCIYVGKLFEYIDKTLIGTTNMVRYDWGWGPNPTINTWFNSNIFQVDTYNFNVDVSIISSIK